MVSSVSFLTFNDLEHTFEVTKTMCISTSG